MFNLSGPGLSALAEWAQILGVVTAVLLGGYRIKKALDARDQAIEKRLDESDAHRAALNTKMDVMQQGITDFRGDMRREFGGNGGGMRQQINGLQVGQDVLGEKLDGNRRELTAMVGAVDAKVDAAAGDIRELTGRFNERSEITVQREHDDDVRRASR